MDSVGVKLIGQYLVESFVCPKCKKKEAVWDRIEQRPQLDDEFTRELVRRISRGMVFDVHVRGITRRARLEWIDEPNAEMVEKYKLIPKGKR